MVVRDSKRDRDGREGDKNRAMGTVSPAGHRDGDLDLSSSSLAVVCPINDSFLDRH